MGFYFAKCVWFFCCFCLVLNFCAGTRYPHLHCPSSFHPWCCSKGGRRWCDALRWTRRGELCPGASLRSACHFNLWLYTWLKYSVICTVVEDVYQTPTSVTLDTGGIQGILNHLLNIACLPSSIYRPIAHPHVQYFQKPCYCHVNSLHFSLFFHRTLMIVIAISLKGFVWNQRKWIISITDVFILLWYTKLNNTVYMHL